MGKQGVNNDNEFFKNSATTDEGGMTKYAVDLGDPEEIEKKAIPRMNRPNKATYNTNRVPKPLKIQE